MCRTASNITVWKPDQLCSFGIGGKCNDTIGECVCYEGYKMDLVVLRQRDCSVNIKGLIAAMTLTLIIGVLGLLYTIIKFSGSEKKSRMVIASSLAGIVSIIILHIQYLVNGFVMDVVVIIFTYLFVSSCFSVVYLIAYSVASPLYRMAQKSEKNFVVMLRSFFVFFRCLQLSIALVNCILNSDFNDTSRDFQYNLLTAIQLQLYGLEAFFVYATIQIIGRRMSNAIQHLLSAAPKNSSYQSTELYLRKVRILLKNLLQVGPGSLIGGMLVPIVYFSTGYFPYLYILFSVVWICMTLLLIVAVVYASKEKPTNSEDGVGGMGYLNSINSSRDTIPESAQQTSHDTVTSYHNIVEPTHMTTIQSVTKIDTVSDPVLLRNDKKWRVRTDWVEVKDANGVSSYYNTVTGEWSFDPPPALA